MEIKKLSRRERDKLRQRQEMLDAALDLFSEKGYHNVSMHEIAGKAEFAIGTLYKFFKNKEDLYKALMLGLCEKFQSELTGAINEKQDEVEKLRSYIRAKGEVFRANISVIRLYFSEAHASSFNVVSGLDFEIQKSRREFFESMAKVFASGVEKKIFNNIADPFLLAIALDSLSNAFLDLWVEAPDKYPYPEDPDTILNILFKGLLVK
ncbi:MAG: TetR/AcrR family transcriptional regulator [Desulfobacteraceae bacterium]|nr:MAG: TetR/AcrR family transcriptional regulator [Desulfobacteraceae bacterium]